MSGYIKLPRGSSTESRLPPVYNGCAERGYSPAGLVYTALVASFAAANMQCNALFMMGFRRLSLGIQDFDAVVQLIIDRLQAMKK